MDAAKILIVDDQIDALRGVSRIMKGAGYETLEASNGADCLKLATDHKPDLILLDVVLPDIDGMEVCRRIKSDPETANISVVLLSSIHTESDSQAKGLEYGADGYIARPIPNRELIARVKSILRFKSAENRLSESEERYRRISSVSSDVSYSCIKSNKDAYSIDWIMGAVERITGYSEEDIKTLSCWSNLVIDEDRAIFDTKVIGITQGSSGSCELRLRHKNGKIVWVASSAECVLVSGTPDSLRLYGGLVDITERKMDQEALLSSEERFRNLFETANDGIFLSDGSTFIECNAKAVQIFGCLENKDIVGHTAMEFSPDKQPDGSSSTEKTLKYVYAALNSDPQTFYWKHCRKDGSTFDAEISLNALTLKGKTYLQGIVRDISEHKRLEQALAESEKRYRLITETIHDCFWIATPDIDKILYVSPAYETIWGRSCESLYKSPRSFVDAMHPDDRNRTVDTLDEHRSKMAPCTVTYRIVRPDGTIRWIEDRSFPVLDENGAWHMNVGVASDITIRKRIEMNYGKVRQSSDSLQRLMKTFFGCVRRTTRK